MSGKATLKSFAALLAEAKLPEHTLIVCLRGDLAAEHEALERALADAEKQGATSLAGSGAGEIVDKIEALELQMREASYEFRLRALRRPVWRALCDEHPPRRSDDTGEIVPTDLIGVNSDTFYDAIIRACLVDPELDDDQWARLNEALTDRQYDELARAAWDLNRRDVDVPFSRAASRMKQSTAGE
jgi:hypothetical protein